MNHDDQHGTEATTDAIIAQARSAGYDRLKTVETDSREFLDGVEAAWWRLQQGELLLTPDPDDPTGPHDAEMAEVVSRLASLTIENVLMTRDALDQHDTQGREIQYVSVNEIQERVVLALSVLFYGGGNEPRPERLTKAEGDAIQAITGNVLDNAHDDPDWDTDEYLTQYYETDAETVLSGLNKVKEMTQS